MKEKNYNIVLRRVIEDAVAIAIPLFASNIGKVGIPMSQSHALELS